MRLSVSAFNAHLKKMGQLFAWRKSFACPCINPNSGAAKPDCPVCHGNGRAWQASVDGHAGVASQKIQLEWAKFGKYESGDSVISVPSDSPLYSMSQFDRVTMLNSTDHFSLVLVHTGDEALRYKIKAVTRVFWLNQSSQIVEGGIPAVADDGSLTWTAGEPPDGMSFTIEGERYAEYFCFGMYPSDRGEHYGALLPRRVILRKFDLFGRTG